MSIYRLKELDKELANDILHSMWQNGLITVKQHMDIMLSNFNDDGYRCTNKIEWLDEYYILLAENKG